MTRKTLELIRKLGILSILDWGNSYCKVIVDGVLQVYPTGIHELSIAELARKPKGTETSPLISFGGKSFLIGDAAIERAGASNWSRDKLCINVLRFGIYSAHPESAVIKQLTVCVPDASLDLDFSKLLGKHSYLFNDRLVNIEILEIIPIDETYGLWLGGQSLLARPDLNNIFVTIGGATVNFSCQNPEGTVLFSGVSNTLGMVSIAKNIARDLKIIHQLPSTPSVGAIMKCMALAEKSPSPYVLPIGDQLIDFSKEFAEAVSGWKKDLGAFLSTALSEEIDFHQYLFCGAGAAYLRSGKNSIIAPNPQTFAIQSLWGMHEN
jgi:hypothetical protein